MTSTVYTGPLQTILCPLPMELFYIIVNYLGTEEIEILTRTSVQLWQSLQAVLYRRAEDKLRNNGRRLLAWAAQHGRLDTNKEFLKFARPKAPLDGLVHSALEKAASAGHEEVVHFLLHVEVNPTLHFRQMDFTKRNSSALIYATAARYTHIVQVLLEAKTDVYIPRMLAGSAEMLAGTLDDVEDPTAIDSTLSMLLMQQGFNVQVTGERRSTLLHYAANSGYAALVAILIELNLDINR